MNVELEFSRKQILDILEKNKAKHIEEYLEALTEYKQKYAKGIEEIRKIARKLEFDASREDLNELTSAINALNSMLKPIDMSKKYDQHINLFKVSVSDTFSMQVEDANALINDEWDDGVRAARSINSMYSTSFK